MSTTLFAQRIDLSEGRKDGVLLYNRARNFDTYVLGFSLDYLIILQDQGVRCDPQTLRESGDHPRMAAAIRSRLRMPVPSVNQR